MIIYTNAGNPFGLKLLICAKFAKKDVQVKTIALNGKIFFGGSECGVKLDLMRGFC